MDLGTLQVCCCAHAKECHALQPQVVADIQPVRAAGESKASMFADDRQGRPITFAASTICSKLDRSEGGTYRACRSKNLESTGNWR
eukprot:1152216-Pelagomonas_calceolata.AAC.5